jgi:hypothetical protein
MNQKVSDPSVELLGGAETSSNGEEQAVDGADRQAFLAAVAEAHYQWSLEYGDDVAFDPALSREGGDYNLHTLDVSASADAEVAFRRAIEVRGWDLSGNAPTRSADARRRVEVDQPATVELAEDDDV